MTGWSSGIKLRSGGGGHLGILGSSSLRPNSYPHEVPDAPAQWGAGEPKEEEGEGKGISLTPNY